MSTHDHDFVSIEEGRAEPVVGEQATVQITEHGNEMRNDRITQMLKSLDGVLTDNKKSYPVEAPMIPRVPTRLREKENLKEYFEPRVVSIGPYHHGMENLKVTQEMKLKFAALFLEEYFEREKEELYFTIRREIEDLKKCYELDATKDYDDDDLAWMFFIDGCVVLHFLDRGIYEIDRADRNTLAMDLLLLENQLPLRVLKLLISSSKDEEDLMDSIQQFIRFTTRIVVLGNQKQPLEDPAHLLDLMRKTYLTEFVRGNEIYNFIEQIFKFLRPILLPLHRIFLPILFLLNHAFLRPLLRNETTVDVQTIQELTEFGIELKPTKTSRLKGITFNHGTLKIPRIHVDHSTAFKFLNLIAYEIGSNSTEKKSERFKVSNYIFSLSSLISQEEDVKQLRVNRILFNNLNSNEDVVKLFQKISTIDFPEHSRNLHSLTLKNMQRYCEKKYNVWRGQFKKRYFGSPWSVIAAVGAVTILILTLLQTIYTILGYHIEHTTKTSSKNG